MTRSQEIILCNSCGAGCPSNSKECIRCGKALAPPPAKLEPITAKVIFMLLFLAIGIAGECTLFVFMSWAKESPNWPTVQGEITSVSTRSSGVGAGKTSSSPDVKFAWSVNGVDYAGGRYTYRQLSHIRGSFSSYKRGKPVKVYYNPANPKIAVLRPGFAPLGYVIAGLMIFAVFFLTPVYHFRVIRKTQERNHELIRTGKLTR